MARFVYSMQNILDMKEKLERQEKNDYSRANVRLLEAQDELERLKDRQREQEEKLRQNLKESMNVRQIKEAENAVEIIKMYVKQQMICVKQRERELEEARTRLALARRERKTFEKLREKAFQQFMEEENKKEQKEVDELVSYRYGVNG
ncbi:MAG: flagellar export protein FliJ [Eubacterium sp.]|nr:flagellar export protein FliJ [Eubacterium sp.]